MMDTYLNRTAGSGGAKTRAVPGRKPDIRWVILNDLVAARELLGLKDRTLQVLRGLLTFLPKDQGSATVVFPSNRTLTERLMGMPESTLRRHLRTLCDIGLIARRDSPNRKRYRVGRASDLSFGLDLAPFFHSAMRVRDLAAQAVEDANTRRSVRARILQRLASIASDDPHQGNIRGKLRRKMTVVDLSTMLETLPDPGVASEVNANDAKSERHIHTEVRTDPIRTAINAIAEIGAMTGSPVATEREIALAGRQAGYALGIQHGWEVARHRLGPTWATMALIHIHRRIDKIRKPDRYLIALVKKAEAGTFHLIEALSTETNGMRRAHR